MQELHFKNFLKDFNENIDESLKVYERIRNLIDRK